MGEMVRIEEKREIPDFDAGFWKFYPRKTKKAHALKMWNRLTSEEKKAAVQALPAHIRHWNGKELEWIPHAGSWLNPVDGRRWEDELPLPGQVLEAHATCAKCGGSLKAGFVKRREGNVCGKCEDAR